MSQAFYYLSTIFQKKIWDMGWERITPVQEKTIPVIMKSDKHVVISSATASGKTEAAFLPILSLVEESAKEELNVLYISPLKALINDQFERIERLCQDLYIPIQRWHGDVSAGAKKKVIDQGAGILQITPESIESLFINRTNELRHLFRNLQFIVIDEIHAFLNHDRGVHLRSLLSRLEAYINGRPRLVCLSATIKGFDFIRRWLDYKDRERVEIIDGRGSERDLFYHLMHFEGIREGRIPAGLFNDLRELTRDHQSLIFCNSRSKVEETTASLNDLAKKEGMGFSYYAHHSSIDKKEREWVEKQMAASSRPTGVVATSTLELGIDIGAIDYVVQIDSTYTVSSLKQRLGRSGRIAGRGQYLQVYTTNNDSLLQSLAVLELLLAGWLESATGYPLPFDILFHQIISICHEHNGLKPDNLIDLLKDNAAFYSLPEEDIIVLLKHMIENEHLEQMKGNGELIVGLEGEKLLGHWEFYAVFLTQKETDVYSGSKRIGSIAQGSYIHVGDNIILSGRLWRIVSHDFERNRIYVEGAKDGKPPQYGGGGPALPPEIPARVHEILGQRSSFDFLDSQGKKALAKQRSPYHFYQIGPRERVIWEDKTNLLFETFTGTKIFQTLVWMLRSYGVRVKPLDRLGRMEIEKGQDILAILLDMEKKTWSPRDLLKHTRDGEMFVSKYSPYLPKSLQEKMHLAHCVDLAGAKDFLSKHAFRLIPLEA